MGVHGCGLRNDNGGSLIDLYQTFQVVIGGSIFSHKEILKYTWTSSNWKTQKQIDHICVSRKLRGSLFDVRNRRGAETSSGDIKIKLRYS